MSTSTPLIVGGVPEHFNEPWLEVERETNGELVQFKSYPGGTGAMVEALSKRELDCALLLTEGAVKYCFERPDECALYNFYVTSPLVWGIHVGSSASAELNSPQDFHRFAISRFGSGSHLMAFVLAKQLGFQPNTEKDFALVGNLVGARKHLAEVDANAMFLWEKAMTDPLVQEGVFRRIGEVPTPWPCFVLCVRRGTDLAKVDQVWQRVGKACERFKANEAGKTLALVQEKFGIRRELVVEWFDQLRFFDKEAAAAFPSEADLITLERVRQTLVELGQLQPNPALTAKEICLLK